jgi:AcrR family transcriptional regulator
MTSLGLRERKKRATRRAIGEAAVGLAIERGLENVRVEDIAAAADVSVRTFSNYFRTKYDAIGALGLDGAAELGEALRSRPPDEPLWPAIRAAVLAQYPDQDMHGDREWVARLRAVMTSEPMRGSHYAVTAATVAALAGAVADRTGADADDLWPEVVAWAVVTATQAGLRRWSLADPQVPLRPLIERALDALERLPPTPARR